ncbi:MAG: cupin protein [Chloroflexi bacterium]|nr:cupin protein [Chloroflexota bacterium]
MTERQVTTTGFQAFDARIDSIESGKKSKPLGRTPIMSATVMVVADGGENNLHTHTGSDEIWLILGGEATFYTENDRVVAKLGPQEGIVVPHDTPYWYESTGSEPLAIIRVGATVPGVFNRRVDLAEPSELIRQLTEPYRNPPGWSGS